MSFSDEFRKADPFTSAVFGRMGLNGHGPQRNTAGPRWNMVAPGRYEMEGGVPSNMQADGNYRSQGAALYPQPMNGGGSPLLPQFPMQTGGGAPMGQLPTFPGLTGGPGQPSGFGPMHTGGGLPPMGGGQSSFGGSSLLPQYDQEPQRQPNPFARFGMYR